jgi:hypothetical protein
MNLTRGAVAAAPRVVSALAIALAVLTGSGPHDSASAGALRYEGSLAYVRGMYLFDRPVTSWTLSSAVAIQHPRWSLRLALPVHLQSSVVTNTGAGSLPGGGPLQSDVSRSGRGGSGVPMTRTSRRIMVSDSLAEERRLAVGDPVVHASVSPVSGRLGSFTLTASAKAPLASEENFGTGRWDAGLGAGFLLAPGGSWMLGLDASWWRLGDLDSLDFRDPLTGSITIARAMRGGTIASLVATAGRSAIPGYDGPITAGVLITRVRPGGSVSAGLTFGFSETAADASVSLSWGVPLRRR